MSTSSLATSKYSTNKVKLIPAPYKILIPEFQDDDDNFKQFFEYEGVVIDLVVFHVMFLLVVISLIR